MRKFVGSAIIIKDKRILLIKRSKNKGSIPNFWALPWGWKEWNETPKETTIREIKEELWLDLEVGKMYSDQVTEKAHFYNFLGTVEWQIILQEEECDWYAWLTYMEVTYLPVLDRVRWICSSLYEEGLID